MRVCVPICLLRGPSTSCTQIIASTLNIQVLVSEFHSPLKGTGFFEKWLVPAPPGQGKYMMSLEYFIYY